MLLGHLVTQQGNTFFYLKSASQFTNLLVVAQKYGKSTIFCEDVDKITEGDRNSVLNDLLNTLDGVQTKNKNLKTIFTTNHEDNISEASRRPGRIDLVLYFGAPNKYTGLKILQSWCDSLDFQVFGDIDWALVKAKIPEDASGAVIAQIGKRVFRRIALTDGKIDTQDILAAIDSMAYHIELMNRERTKTKDGDEALKILFKLLAKEVRKEVYDMIE